MAQKPDEILNHIDKERQRLGHNIDEIEDRIKGATDLRGYFNRNTGIFLGSAVAAGVIASLAMRRHRSAEAEMEISNSGSLSGPSITSRLAERHMGRITETFDNILEGLIGVACGKIVSLIADAIPSFQEEYEAHQRDPDWSSIRTVNPKMPPDATTSSQ